jgi:hypothetical protein
MRRAQVVSVRTGRSEATGLGGAVVAWHVVAARSDLGVPPPGVRRSAAPTVGRDNAR